MPLDGSKLAPIATRMREQFGPNGERWGHGGSKRCIMLTLWRCVGAGEWTRAIALLRRAFNTLGIPDEFELIHYSAMKWNDAPERTYADIRRVVDEIERMEIAGELG